MLDRENLLKVAEAVLATEQANERIGAAQARLETARAAVETVRTEIQEAKEGAIAAKANLETTIAVFDNSGVSKATIIKAAEELNRVFHGIGLIPSQTEEAEVEPELGRATLKKLAERISDKITASGLFDTEDEHVVIDDVKKLLEDIQAAIVDGAGQATKASAAKDGDAQAGKRKRRSKAEIAAETAAETPAVVDAAEVVADNAIIAPVEPVVGADKALVPKTTEEEVTGQADEATIELVAEVVVTESTPVETAEEVVEAAEVAAGIEEPPASEINDDLVHGDFEDGDYISNDHVRDEVLSLIDDNVTQDHLSGILTTAVYAVYLKADAERAPLNLYQYLDAMTVSAITEAAVAPYAEKIASDLAPLAADLKYLGEVLAWFQNGVRLIEDGKGFPEFVEPVSVPDDTVEVAADEVFTAADELPSEVEAVLSIGDVDFLAANEPEAAPVEQVVEPAVTVAEPGDVAPPATAVVKPAAPVIKPPPFMKPGFMKG